MATRNRNGGAYEAAFEAVGAILIATLLGYWFDEHYGTTPTGLIVGAVIGFASFVLRLVRLARRLQASAEADAAAAKAATGTSAKAGTSARSGETGREREGGARREGSRDGDEEDGDDGGPDGEGTGVGMGLSDVLRD